MQFHVPQFIEVENKIFGPLTFKQFAYLIGGAGLIFLIYTQLPLWLTVLLAIPAGGMSFALAFLKIHGKPFIEVVEKAIKYFSGARLYIWKKPTAGRQKENIIQKIGTEMKSGQTIPKLTRNKLQDLAWSLDVKEKVK